MAIGTYAQLQATIPNWLHRGDLAALVPDFIAMAESRLNRLLQIRSMEREVLMAMVPGTRFVALPAGMNKPIALWIGDAARAKLTNQLPENLTIQANSGAPSCWAVDNENLAFDRPADQPYVLSFRYIKKFALSDDEPTNALLTAYPDVYLYATLLEAAPYMGDAQQLPMWQERLDRAIQEVRNNDNKTRAVAPLSVDSGLPNGCATNRGFYQ